MGWLEELAEGCVSGLTFGLSDEIGITGKGGIIHDTDADSILIDDNGVSFIKSEIQIGWKDIANIGIIKGSEEEGQAVAFTFRGGLSVYSGALFIDDRARSWSAACRRIVATELPDGCDTKDLLKVADDLEWAIEIADEIRGTDENLVIDEDELFRQSVIMCFKCRNHLDIAKGRTRTRVREVLDSFRARIRTQFLRLDAEDAGVKELIAIALYILSDREGSGVQWQKKKYEELSAAAQHGIGFDRAKVIYPLLEEDGESAVLGDAKWYKTRKTIICTNETIELGALFSEADRILGVMIMNAADIEEYNANVESEYRLVFQPGHPQNGCTYIQHPLRQNVYFEVNSFHDSMRERKQNELLRILESLGAYSAHVEVCHGHEIREKSAHELHTDTSVNMGTTGSEMSQSATSEQQTKLAMSQRATKDWSFNPPDKPSLPDDLVFYPTEETWQQLVRSVLRGGLKRAQVDLEYKTEYGITEKHLSDVATSVKNLLPLFDMNLKQQFSSDLYQLTTTQWHYGVTFENENGERAGAKDSSLPSVNPLRQSVDRHKAEALFAKRAKRYAQSEGHINAEQRADLEALAAKYGIDEFRMEELIEEAFV